MAVIGIRESLNGVDQRLVADDQTVTDRAAHQFTKPMPLGLWHVRAVRTKRRECLIEDLVRSPSLHEASLCDPDQKVAQSIGVENVRVVHHYE
ncbi:MAG: hypothetical protein U0990_09900 [Candidatus Nanopelagicales bacterium]|nr:hypothetical protein [Candidatus Nanopelagicales bacterium]MDZ4250389.1 hypothetical protein [Candidatus Nanopelagicales bacterium]